MEEIKVALGERSYKILIGRENLKELGRVLKDYNLGKRVTVISNPLVGGFYQDIVEESLKKEGFEVAVICIPDGEEYKSLAWASVVYDELLIHKRDKHSLILALGGGAIGDLAGFVASTYMRGVPLIQVPTSLLAQADASIGGKVAVNHFRRKNLIGFFYQPRLVYTDLALLRTLAPRELASGLAEIIKYGMIRDKALFLYLEKNVDDITAIDLDVVEKVVTTCARLKAELVSRDEREKKGIRGIINYGHTISNILEVLTGLKVYRHGEAVSLGMVVAAGMAQKMGVLDEALAKRQIVLLEKAGLPIKIKGIAPSKIMEALIKNKKASGRRIRFILATGIGQVEMRDDVPEEIIEEVLEEITELE